MRELEKAIAAQEELEREKIFDGPTWPAGFNNPGPRKRSRYTELNCERCGKVKMVLTESAKRFCSRKCYYANGIGKRAEKP